MTDARTEKLNFSLSFESSERQKRREEKRREETNDDDVGYDHDESKDAEQSAPLVLVQVTRNQSLFTRSFSLKRSKGWGNGTARERRKKGIIF